MKKKHLHIVILQLIFISLILGLCLFSCQKNESAYREKVFDYEQIGIDHNKGMEYIFEYLKSETVNKQTDLRNAPAIFDLTEQATLSLIQREKIINKLNFDQITPIFEKFNFDISRSGEADDLVSSIHSKIPLSDIQIYYLNQLDEIISNLEIGLEPTIAEIKKLESDIITQCTKDEVVILLSSTSVARHSLKYWTDNYEKWLIELGENPDKKQNVSTRSWFSDTIKDMGKADAVGGAIGACVGSIAGGVGAAPGAVSGACYSSAGRGICSLLDHWGVW